MKKLILLSLLVVAGCAHEMTVPASVENAQSQADNEMDSGKVESARKENEQTAEIQKQANGKPSELKATGSHASATLNVLTSNAMAAEVFRRMPLIKDARALTYANAVGQYMAEELIPSLKCRADGTQPSAVRVAIVKSSTPSSFSLPGGRVFVTTAFVQKMTNEDELAGVIANELVLSVCQKGASAAAEILLLPTKSMSLADLEFADKYALVTLYRRGYDVAPYVSFVAKNETSGRHLFGGERAALLKKSVDATPAITSTSAARRARFNAAKSKAM